MEMVKNENQDQEMAMKKKKSRGMHVIRVVLFMLRRRRRKPFKSGFWRRLVESVRQLNKPSDVTIMPASNITVLPPPEEKAAAEDGGGDALVEQLSETVEAFTAASSSSSSGISGYGSAMSLRDMDCQDYDDDDYGDDDEDDDDRHCYGEEGGDDMIDAKAEEFIANFYAQIRMQNQAYTEHYKTKRV